MRLAAASLIALALSTTLSPPAADACGGKVPPVPAMYLVAEHHGRTFVLLGTAVPVYVELPWQGDGNSYDRTELAPAPALPRALEITLVGGTATRTMRSRNQIYITPVFESHRAMNALEIYPSASERPRVAIAGAHDATWLPLERAPSTAGLVDVYDVTGTQLHLVTTYVPGGDATTQVRWGANPPGAGYRGTPVGVVTVDGARYMVLANDGVLTPIAV